MDSSELRLLLPPRLRETPRDLVLVALLTIITDLSVFLPFVSDTALRIVFGLPFVLFAPGYVLIAALFPEEPRDGEGIDGLERVALSFGLSIAVVPLIGLLLNFTPWGIRLAPIMASLNAFIAAAIAAATYRRLELPVEQRFEVPLDDWFESLRLELLEPGSRGDKALNLLLAISIVLAIGSVVYAVAVPKQGEQFTEFYLLTENDGELVAANYPAELGADSAFSIYVGIGNQEHEQVDYAGLVRLQRVEFIKDGTGKNASINDTRVLAQQELKRFTASLKHNETRVQNVSLRPSLTGQRLRLQFLLYKDEIPINASEENAYRELHLWLNVTRPR